MAAPQRRARTARPSPHGQQRSKIHFFLGLIAIVAAATVAYRTLFLSPFKSFRPVDDEHDVIHTSHDTSTILRVDRDLSKEEKRALRFAEIALPTSHENGLHIAGNGSRGIILPLFDGIAQLGASLIRDLDARGVDIPYEVPHCGDLNAENREMIQSQVEYQDRSAVRIYDVCKEASELPDDLFCRSLEHCHRRFRGFDIKLISLVFSKFTQVMMLDADVQFFLDPMRLWQSEQYTSTGTFFFRDRMSQHGMYAGNIKHSIIQPHRTELSSFFQSFDLDPFRVLRTEPRPRATLRPDNEDIMDEASYLPFSPSDELLSSHVWNLRSGHHVDSSVLLWDKQRQVRATALVGSFAADGAKKPPSYGDKELYFVACELAETKYGMSPYGVGSYGMEVQRKHKPNDPDAETDYLCGQALHFDPMVEVEKAEDAPAFYVNSEALLELDPDKKELHRTKALDKNVFPGWFHEWDLPQECPFNVGMAYLSEAEKQSLRTRQEFFRKLGAQYRAV